LPGCRIEGIVARKKKLKIRKIIVTPEQLISYRHRRYAEYSLGNRLIRLCPELAFDFRGLSLRNKRGAQQTDLVRDALYHSRVANM